MTVWFLWLKKKKKIRSNTVNEIINIVKRLMQNRMTFDKTVYMEEKKFISYH